MLYIDKIVLISNGWSLYFVTIMVLQVLKYPHLTFYITILVPNKILRNYIYTESYLGVVIYKKPNNSILNRIVAESNTFTSSIKLVPTNSIYKCGTLHQLI